jgi:RNA polymerase sigma-70 factor (ECF subfamily)
MGASITVVAQRAVEAHATIRVEGLRFEAPEGPRTPRAPGGRARRHLWAYTIGSSLVSSVKPAALPAELSAEAEHLARLVAQLEPDSAEAQGLLARMLLCEGRRPAQFDRDGRFVPLAVQDVRLCRTLVEEGERRLMAAGRMQTPRRFQWEAAIQSAHCQRLFTGETPWTGIVQLYEALVGCHGGLGARICRAVAVGDAAGAAAGLAALTGVAESSVANYQPSGWRGRIWNAGPVSQAKHAHLSRAPSDSQPTRGSATIC